MENNKLRLSQLLTPMISRFNNFRRFKSKAFIRLENDINLDKVFLNIRFFYLLVLVESFGEFAYLYSGSLPESIIPLWPVYWVSFLSVETGIKITGLFVIVSAFLAFYKADFRLFRVVTFIGLLEFIALINSFGKISHSNHLLVLISFILILMPDNWDKSAKNSEKKSRIGSVYLGCLSIIMLTYALSGFWKIEEGIIQLFRSQIGSLNPEAMAYQISGRLLETNSKSLLGDFFIEHYWISWPLYLGSIYLEFCSIFIVLKPGLHRLWGGVLIVFHIFVYLTMTIIFSNNIFLLGIFFMNSPYKLTRISIVKQLEELPLIGNQIRGLAGMFYSSQNKNLK